MISRKKRAEVEALGDGVTMAAMIGGERIVGPQRAGDADRDRFLADRQMDEARNFAVGEQQATSRCSTSRISRMPE